VPEHIGGQQKGGESIALVGEEGGTTKVQQKDVGGEGENVGGRKSKVSLGRGGGGCRFNRSETQSRSGERKAI